MYLPFGKRHQASGYRHQIELSFPARGFQRTPGGFGCMPGAAPDLDAKSQSRIGYEPLKPDA
jgi:hypothetical protein